MLSDKKISICQDLELLNLTTDCDTPIVLETSFSTYKIGSLKAMFLEEEPPRIHCYQMHQNM